GEIYFDTGIQGYVNNKTYFTPTWSPQDHQLRNLNAPSHTQLPKFKKNYISPTDRGDPFRILRFI
ncbi:Hypothetical protein FKW44_012848, partial [Caligus rogercresseyi]